MKSFKQYITEKPAKLSASFPYKGAGWREFRGLENPTEKEILAVMKKAKFSEVRFVIDGKGKMWAWDSDHDLHDAVIFGMTGQKYNGDYAKGIISFLDIENEKAIVHREGNLKVTVMNTRTVGTNFALKNRTMKAIAKRINTKDADKRVYWTDV